jgi:alpha-glucosidase
MRRQQLSALAVAAALAAGTGPSAPAAAAAPATTTHRLSSPNGRIEVAVEVGARIAYGVSWDGKPLLRASTLSLDVDHNKLGVAPALTGTRHASVDRQLTPPVRLSAATLPERYDELRLEFAGGYAVVFRAYDQGVAYRFETALPAREVKVYGEEATFAFAADADAYYPKEDGFLSHNERMFRPVRLSQIPPAALASIPAVVETPAGPKVAITDADVEDYPGLWFRGTSGAALAAVFPPVALEEKRERELDIKVVKAADYIAVTRGTRTYPWRALVIAPQDRDLPSSTLTYLLARPSEIADTSWIRPGKVAWDWWNDWNLRGVDFKPGVNTKTYQRYIDFAAQYGLEYVILDEGWSKLGDLLSVVPEIDMPALLAYARKKNVGIILWVVWKTFEDQMEPALAQFEKWGVRGLKVDFMQRDDQAVMNFYTRACRELAKRKMLVDFHGGIRPTLLARTWPNLVSTEGVQGMEHLKWSANSDPEHNVTIPFTRMLLGPMDYTPGAMVNATRAAFKVQFKAPMSLGTRAHQLGMYVVYESPLQMLADTPSNYVGEPEAMELLGPVPTTWDETRVLDGRIGDYVVIARRKGKDWYLGAMTDWTARELDVDLAFLGEGRFQMTAWEDGPNAATVATDCRKSARPVDRSARLRLKLAPGGGFAARIVRAP